ncbi:hypothetical protein [Sorangium sp. So ce406]|uniref:hypothetical protein n=1 Tax=Sorangium sp. So ce406 TaxID=3133311 RepID=UPI003F5B5B0D
MGYDVAAIAAFEVPAEALAGWKRRKIDPAAYTDWPDPLEAEGASPATVAAIFSDLAKRLQGLPHGLRDESGRIELAAVLPEHIFTAFGARLAAALRASADVGGRGRLDFIGFRTSPLSISFEVRPEGTTVRTPLEDEEIALIEKSAPFVWLERTADGETAPLPAFKKLKKPSAKAGAADKAPTGKARSAAAAAEPAPAAAASGDQGFDVIVSGEVQFAKKAECLKWGRTKVRPADLAGWPAALSGKPGPPTSPQDLTWQVQEMDPPLAFFRVNADESRAFVKGALGAGALSMWGTRLAAVFRAASAHGGRGRLWMLSPPGAPPRGFVIDVQPDDASIREATPADLEAAAGDALHGQASSQFGGNLSRR